MTPSETVESLLFQTGESFDQIDPATWVLLLGNRRGTRVLVMIEDPIVLLTVQLFKVDANTPQRERLFQTLLELNADLLRSAYTLEVTEDENRQVVLSAALQVERLELEDLQAVLDDMTMALDTHLDKLSDWQRAET